MSLGGLAFSLGSLICACSPFLSLLFIGRAIAGVGEGLFISIVAVYCVEIAPARLRGRITSLVQLGVAFGICTGFFVCYATAHLSSSFAWRVPFILQAGWAFLYAIGCLVGLPFSPRWLHMKGRVVEAERTRSKLYGSPEPADWELTTETKGVRLRDLFAKDVRLRTFLALFLQGRHLPLPAAV